MNTSLGGTIEVTAASTISLSSAAGTGAQTVCIDNAITDITFAIGGSATGGSLSGTLPAGVTGSYDAGTFTITGTPTASGVFNYTVTADGTCPVSINGSISVNANSTIAFTSAVGTDAQTRCINTAITAIAYTVGGGATGASASGLPTGVSGSYNAGTKVFTISGSASVAGSFAYTVTTTGPCIQTSLGGTLDITADATIALTSGAGSNNQAVCQNASMTDITYAVGGSGTGATVSGLPAGVTGSFDAGVFTISGTPTAAGTFNYTVTTTGPCVKPSLGGTITVNALPTAVSINPTSVTICVGTNTNLVASGLTTASGTIVNDPFTGTPTFTTTGSVAGGRSQTWTKETSGTAVNSSGTFTSPNGGGVMIAMAAAAAVFGTSTSTAATTMVSAAISTVGYSSLTLSYRHAYKEGNVSGEAKVEISTNGGSSYTTIKNYTVNVGTSTGFATESFAIPATYLNQSNVRIRFNLTAENSSSFSAHSSWWAVDDVLLNGQLLPLFSWTADTGAGVNGLPANAGTPSATNKTISVNPSATTIYTLTAQNPTTGCGVSTATSTVSVTANATIDQTSAAGTEGQTLCINNAITDITYAVGGSGTGASASGLPAGVTGSYVAGVFTISGTPTVAGSFNYTVNTAGPCVTPSMSGNITVTPDASVNLSSASGSDAQSVCVNNAISSITYNVGGSGNDAQITAGALPAGVTGSFAAGVFTISGTPSEAGSFSYTITATGPCAASAPISGTLFVSSVSTIALSSAAGTDVQAVCRNAAINPIAYTVGGSANGAGVTGLPTGITGSFNAGVFTISGSTAVAGTFNYTVTTTGPCAAAVATGSITINTPPTATFVKTNVSACNAQNDGTITITPSGVGPFSYSWSGVTGSGNPASTPYPNPGNVNAVSGLPIGFYDVTVTDANGCSVTLPTIQIQFAFSSYVTNNASNSAACANTGSITLYVNSGVSPFQFSLDGTNYQTSNVFSNLAPNNYTAYVKDAAGCVVTKAITISAAAPMAINPFVRPATSCAADGSIEIYRTGGVPPYSYSLGGVNYQTSNKFFGLAAGSYTAYVKDSKGCISSQSVLVTQGNALSVTANKTNTSSCTNDGSIQVSATGGVAPFTYSKDGGANYQVGNSFTGLGAGTYAISVKDSKGCLGTTNVTISLNPIVVTSFVTDATTCGGSDGSVQLFRTGGVGPYSYSKDGNTYQASNMFTGLTPGIYDFFVKDSKTCIGSVQVLVGPGDCMPAGVRTTNTKAAAKVTSSVLKVKAYPNPSASSFRLTLENAGNAKTVITVTDLAGKKVYQTEGTAKQQYTFGSSFLPGMYLLQVVQGNEKHSIKLVKE